MVKKIVKVHVSITKENKKVYTTVIRTGPNRFHHALGMKIIFGRPMVPPFIGKIKPVFWVYEDIDILKTRKLAYNEIIVECYIPKGIVYKIVNHYTLAVELLHFKQTVAVF